MEIHPTDDAFENEDTISDEELDYEDNLGPDEEIYPDRVEGGFESRFSTN